MSGTEQKQEEADEVCANCGKAAVDNIKLKICTACKLVKYCSVDCQKNHRKQHKKACKKRMAELRDHRLFMQPDGIHLGECPICCLPLPIDVKKSTFMSCCSKVICNGCTHANRIREMEQGLEHKCPFCREPLPKSDEEAEKMNTKRVKANDPVTLREAGKRRKHKGDYEGAFAYFTKAAGLEDMEAHFQLSALYHKGEGVEKDEEKYLLHSETAAIGGHPIARYNLACVESRNEMYDRAKKHHMIAANLGYDDALKRLREGFQIGIVKKEDFEAALRGHQAAVDATKSAQREEASYGKEVQKSTLGRLMRANN